MAQQQIKEHTHVISVLVENEFGVLARIAQLFAARGFNIESLTVGPTHDATCSRMTVVVKGDDTLVGQVRKQLEKLIEVIAIQNLSESGHFLAREMMLVKVHCTAENRTELMNIGKLFDAKALDYTPGSMTFELCSTSEKLDNFILFLQPFGIAELGRSGVVGMNRGMGGLQSDFTREVEEQSV